MSDGPEWFAQKRFGYGATQVTWQGWAITLIFTAIVLAAAYWLHRKPLALTAIVLPLSAVLILIIIKTTKGGWRWRWGQRD